MAETTGAVWALSDAEIPDSLMNVWKQEQALAAVRLSLVQEAAVRDLARRAGATSLPGWLSGLLRITGGRARQMADLANALHTACAATAQALADGVVNEAQASVTVKALDQIKDAGAAVQREAEAALLSERCAGLDPVTLAKAAARILDHVAPHLAEENCAEIWSARKSWPLETGRCRGPRSVTAPAVTA